MIKRLYILLIILLAYIQMSAAPSETKRNQFLQISSEQGLSNNSVISIVQDNNDAIWFATFDGLNRYDGYTFKVYRNERRDKHSLLNDVLRTLFFDHDNQLWIGSKIGLSRYIPESDHFDNYLCEVIKDRNTSINSIVEFDESNLLLGTDAGLLLFNKNSKLFTNFQAISNKQLIVQCLSRRGNNIFIGTNNGFFIYNTIRKYFSPVHSELKNKWIQTILPQSDTKIWIGTEGAGLYLFDPLTGEIKNFRKNPANSKSLCSNFIRSLAFDSEYRLWVGTFNGLSIMSNGEYSFDNYYHDPMVFNSISQNSVRAISMDNQGGIWLGTYYGGINYYHPLKNRFAHIQQNPYTRSLNDRVISCIIEDETGKIWIGTNDKGINEFDPKTGSFKYFTHENNSNIISNNIKCFLQTKDKKSIYVGSHGGGVFLLNKSTGNCSSIKALNSLSNENVYALTYDCKNTLWIGTLNGLYTYNETTKEIFKVNIGVMNSNQVMFLKSDSHKRLWIGSDKSLGIYWPETKKMQCFKSEKYYGTTSSGTINCIFEDSKKRIWIGTLGGLNLYLGNGRFKLYTKEDGLPSNVIYGILEDSYGRLWLSTNNGISCFSQNDKQFRNYSEVDGLPFRQFNLYSFCQSRNGLMYFGGINGITTFYPELLIDNPYTPKPKISRIQVLNKDIHPFDNTGILTNNISATKKIRLRPDQSNLSLEIVVSNFLSGRHNIFAYKLEGFDKDWIYTVDNRIISYSNLNHGKYIFKVKAANSDEKWNEEPTELTIVILPHWYQTWWAILLFCIMACGIGYLAIRFVRQRQDMQNELRIERIEKEKMEEVNQMKMRFFINISHEFRTPLSLIIAPLQEMIERNTDKWLRSQLKHVYKNANKLLHLVNQLMDYRRAELGVFELNVHRIKPAAHVKETYALFEKLAKQKMIDYDLIDQTAGKEFLIDPNYMELIISNLLSNAFKFTPEKGKISVRIIEDLNNFILEVEDSGCGIAPDKQGLIFDRFYQIGNDNFGTGIGLSLINRLVDLHHGQILLKSELGKGSVFSVYFPQNVEVYDSIELEQTTKDVAHTTNSKNVDYMIEETNSPESLSEESRNSDTIMIVEDNEDILEYMTEKLSNSYNIITAQNGLVALEKLKSQAVDLILTDVMMPEMDGIKLCKSIKQNIRTCHIPIIILSAKTNIEDQLEGLQVGADDYLSKPFTYSVLSAKIQNMLVSRRRMIEHYSSSSEIEPEKITFNEMDKELLTKAMNVVLKHLDNTEFSTDIFCSEMAMSRTNLHIKLKAITGESTIDFIRKIRFNEASKLLLDGRYNIAEVSTRVGFNTQSYFATSFKKYFGCLPTEYVKNHRT